MSSAERSVLMSRVGPRDTAPEKTVRRLLCALGHRAYRLNVKSLPGRPDVVFRRKKVALFVHGCFWHYHECSAHARVPKSRAYYWREKLLANRARDEKAVEALKALGWSVLVVWECHLKDEARLSRALAELLKD